MKIRSFLTFIRSQQRANALLLPVVIITLALQTLPVFATEDKVLWDEWYTVTIQKGQKKIPYSYYNEKVELKNGKLYFKNDVWKKEEGYINRESLGAFAENNDQVTPLFYNFHSTFRTSETTIDGTVENKMLTAKTREGKDERPVVKKGLPSNAFFSVFFPVWIGKNFATFQKKKNLEFTTILEDDVEHGFMTMEGRMKLEKNDDTADKTKTTKFSLDYRGDQSLWWTDSKGRIERIEMPKQNVVVTRSTRDRAIKFLD